MMPDIFYDLKDAFEHSSLRVMIGELSELVRFDTLIMKGGKSRYDERGERKFIKTYRGFDIYTEYGRYSKTRYTTSIITEHTFPSGETHYGKGFFVFAVDTNGVYSDSSIPESYWVRVNSGGMHPVVNSEERVKKGIEKAIRKVENDLDWHIAFIQKLREQDDREKRLEKSVIDAVNKG